MKSFSIVLLLFMVAGSSLMAKDYQFDFTTVSSILVDSDGEKTQLDIKDKKYILVYYSSNWCADCRMFTPKLVDFYNNHSKGTFEIVFMSLDFSEEKQLSYMHDEKMPWPALQFSNLKSSGLFDYSGCVMPWISVFKTDGTMLPNHELNLLDHTPEEIFSILKETMNITESEDSQ